MDTRNLLEFAEALSKAASFANDATIYTVFVVNGDVVVKTHESKDELKEYCIDCRRQAMSDRYGKYKLLIFYGKRWNIRKLPFRIETGDDILPLSDPGEDEELVDIGDGDIGGVLPVEDLGSGGQDVS